MEDLDTLGDSDSSLNHTSRVDLASTGSQPRTIDDENQTNSPVICHLKRLVEQNDLKRIRSLLYGCIWERFSLEPLTDTFGALGKKEAPDDDGELLPDWFLHAAVFTGCPVLVEYTLGLMTRRKLSGSSPDTGRTRRRRSNGRKATLEDLGGGDHMDPAYHVNHRIDCKFPLTDTWIHRSFKLNLSPLHLACWRLDHRAILALLAHGADPNILALEETSEHDFVTERGKSATGSPPAFVFSCHGGDVGEVTQAGLCPLHFIALGIRAPPETSLFAGIQENIMHDTQTPLSYPSRGDTGQGHTRSISEECLPLDTPHYSCSKSSYGSYFKQMSFDFSSSRESFLTCSLLAEREKGNPARYGRNNSGEGVTKCIEALLSAGAKPNFCPAQKVLIGASPLDTILQPPMRIFYAPNASRGHANPMSLRRYDLVQTAHLVIAACSVLLRHGASISPFFQDLYAWKPGILDCFHLHNIQQAGQLVKYCIRLGLFSAHKASTGLLFDKYYTPAKPNSNEPLARGRDTAPESSVHFDPMIMRRFVADVINMEIPLPLASIVLHWCPFALLQSARKEIKASTQSAISRGEVGGPVNYDWSRTGLAELAQIVKDAQLATLRHKCALLVLEGCGFKSENIESLPLPHILKRGLTDLDL